MMINSTTFEVDPASQILEYLLLGTSVSVIIICIFWIWYYVSSVYINRCEASRVNKQESTNAPQRLSQLKSQRIKYTFFISIISFELIRKSLALMEYFYTINMDPKYQMVEITRDGGAEKECFSRVTDMNELAMKAPLLILIRALNLTCILCLISLVGITMLYLSKMYKGDRKLTSVNALVIILALKSVLVLILSSAVFLSLAGLFVWIISIIIDWFLICIFAVKLINTINSSRRNQEIPLELKLAPNKNIIREYRVITCVTGLVVAFVFIYIVGQVIGVAVDIADFVIIRTCFFWHMNIKLNFPSGREIIDYIDTRDILISCIYIMCFVFNLAIILSHFYFLLKNGRKVGEKLFCRQKQVMRYEIKQQELEEPLLNDNNIWTDETIVKKIEVSSSSNI